MESPTIHSAETSEAEEPVSILAVDDRPENLLALEAVLVPEGYRVVTARSGEEALRHLLAEEFGAVLLDLEMPGMSGIEVAALVKGRERTRHTPLLFVTASSHRGAEALEAYAQGAADFLVKPVEPLVLKAKLAVFADLHRMRHKVLRMAARLQLRERDEAARQVEAVRQAGEARYLNLAQAVPVIVWLAGPDGEITYWNQTWTAYTGLPLEASVGRGWLSAVHPDDLARIRRAWGEAVAAGREFLGECRFRGRDGAYRWHQCRALPERDPAGKLTGWVGTDTDIEERKRTEEAQAEALAEVQESLRARDAFLSVASHELKTPLTSLALGAQAISRFVRPLLQDDSEGARLANRLDAFQRQITRMTRLINDLLDLSQVSAGRLSINPEEVDLVELVRQCAAEQADPLREAGCKVELALPERLAARCDPRRFCQVVTNLLSNACKYGHGHPVRVALREEGGRAVLEVADGGIGIPAADQARIFDRFERAVSENQYSGFGLGLWITRQIVDAHGGRIRVESRAGQGATFTVELPLHPA